MPNHFPSSSRAERGEEERMTASTWCERRAPTCPRSALARVYRKSLVFLWRVRLHTAAWKKKKKKKKIKTWTVAKRGLSRWLRYHTVRSCFCQQQRWAETEGWLTPATFCRIIDGYFDLLSALRSNSGFQFSFSKLKAISRRWKYQM